MPMPGIESEIGELRYKIGRVELEINHLKKTLIVRKKNKVLTQDEEDTLNGQIAEKQAAVRKLEGEIRRIEVAEIRKKNFG